jgi:ADP-dependent NAD(P)H-hydrate dehydratase
MTVTDVDLALLRTMPIPAPGSATDKNSRGRVFLIAGSSSSPGAAVLAGEAALRAGAGKIVVGIPEAFAAALGCMAPEFGLLPLGLTDEGEPEFGDFAKIERCLENCDAVLVGPGLMDDNNAHRLARSVLRATDQPVVLDAAAITAFRADAATLRASKRPCILTPHAGEIAALTGTSRKDIESDPSGVASNAARGFNSIIVLKGAETFIANPEGRVWRHAGGVPGLATAGSGDVLAGLLAALIARGTAPVPACLWSVYIHAIAGATLAQRIGPLGFLARELPGLFPEILGRCSRRSSGTE